MLSRALRIGWPLLWSIAALALLAVSAASAEGPTPAHWWKHPHLTGDWHGRRQALADRGIAPGARYTTGFWSNVRGGFETGTRYEGFAQWWLEADLEALLGWTGGSFDANWYSYHGGQPSEDLVGLFPTQAVSGWETAVSVRFYELFLRQVWGGGRFAFKAGQLAADTDFFVSENAADLLNGSFGFLGLGRELSPFYPLAAPGAYLRARTQDARWEVHVGVYTEDPGEDKSSNFGFDWSFDNGAFLLGELRTRRSPLRRPGSYAVGVVGTTADLEDFKTGGSRNGGFGLYGLIDQLIIEQTQTRPGFGVFLRSFGGLQEDRARALWYVDFGLKLTRPFRAREDDVLALGFAYTRFADPYVASRRAGGVDVSRYQSVLEITYRLQVTGWLTLQPDLQLFFEPHFSRRDATVIGLRAVVEL